MPALGLALGLSPQRPAPAGVVPPATPTGFAATAQESAIELSWDALPEADTFEILFSLENNIGTAASLAAGVTGTTFTHDSGESIQVGEKYYYWIKAVNAAGESDYSASVTARSYVTLAATTTVSLITPTGIWTLNTLFFRSGGNLPAGCNMLYGADIFASTGEGTWEDAIYGGIVNPAIAGAFDLENTTGSPTTFWNTEP